MAIVNLFTTKLGHLVSNSRLLFVANPASGQGKTPFIQQNIIIPMLQISGLLHLSDFKCNLSLT